MKKALYLSILIVSVLIIQSFVRSIINVWQKQSLIDQATFELTKEKKEHELLLQQAELVKKQHFIEEEARNKLLMVKANEAHVIIPSELLPKEQKQQVASNDPRPYWQQWAQLFF